MYRSLSGIMVISARHIGMPKKNTGSKVDWLREMREKQFDEATRPPKERSDSDAKRRGPKKGNKG
jgi:hypothetical protein